jgi:hypothetical protein
VWKWQGRKIERVNEFRFLGNTFNERSTVRAKKVVGCVWGIGESKWGGAFKRRMMMFESLIESISKYGAEIWEWKEQEEVEKVQEE